MSAAPLDAGDDARVITATVAAAGDDPAADGAKDQHHKKTSHISPKDAMYAIDQHAMLAIAEATRRKLGDGVIDKIQQWAVQAKHLLAQSTVDWTQATAVDLAAIRNTMYRDRLVRVEGMVQGMTDPVEYERTDGSPETIAELAGNLPVDSDRGQIRGLAASLTLANEKNEIRVGEFYDTNLVTFLQENAGKVANIEALVLVSMAPNPWSSSPSIIKSEFVFHLIALRPLTTALQIVRPVAGEEQRAIERFAGITDMLVHAVDLAVESLDLKRLDDAPWMPEALAFQALSAATEGLRGHTLLIGPPGVGKGEIHKAAELFQPIYMRADPTKITEAGLIGQGSTKRVAGRAGLLPRAHTGAFSIEDFNRANSVKNQRCIAAFTPVMQGGRITDASVSRCTYQAEVAMILDCNRRADVDRRGYRSSDPIQRFVADTGIPLNILSRMTYVVEIPRDPMPLTLCGVTQP